MRKHNTHDRKYRTLNELLNEASHIGKDSSSILSAGGKCIICGCNFAEDSLKLEDLHALVGLHHVAHAKSILIELCRLLYRLPPKKIEELQTILDKGGLP